MEAGSPRKQRRSIAVLPFANLTSDPGQDSFSTSSRTLIYKPDAADNLTNVTFIKGTEHSGNLPANELDVVMILDE